MTEKLHKTFSARSKISNVSFKGKFNTSFGSSLFVVGNLKILGNWNINDAIALSTTSDTYPVWTQKNAFSCNVGTELIYKYFVKDSEGKITWEQLPNNINRKVIISKPGEFIIEDEENKIGAELGKTEDYDSIISDIKPKSEKKDTKKPIIKSGKKSSKKVKKNDVEDKKEVENEKKEEEENNEDTNKSKKKKKKKDNQKFSGPLSSQGLTNFYKKLDENITDEKDELDINNGRLNDNSNLIDLKINLDKNFKINDLYKYDINLINKMNSGLFESFLFSSNQNIIETDRLVFVDEFLPFILKKNENCEEDDIENKYIIIPNRKYSSIMNLVKKINCGVCWVGMLKNIEDFEEIELEEIIGYLEEKMIYIVQVKKKQYEDYYIYYNNILMPTFIDNSISSDNEYNQNYDKYYSAFQFVNRKFAKALSTFADMNDLIMINDMNLCFVPNALALRNKLNWRIGIYIHLCFPASDVFKAFPNSIDIMYSLILCDVIGFHV